MASPTDNPSRDETLLLDRVHARRGGTTILRGIELSFAPGSRSVLIGPSGAGKTTLLRLLNRLDEPSDGQIRLGETPITAYPVTRLRRIIGLVFQSPRPFPGTIAESLAYPGSLVGEVEPSGFDEAMAEVGLDPAWLTRETAALSGGERQRLALAVALRTRPAVLGLDEPTAALDPTSARRIAGVLKSRSERDGLTTIVVTHDRELAADLGDRAVAIEAGRVIDDGPTRDVLARVGESAWKEGGR